MPGESIAWNQSRGSRSGRKRPSRPVRKSRKTHRRNRSAGPPLKLTDDDIEAVKAMLANPDNGGLKSRTVSASRRRAVKEILSLLARFGSTAVHLSRS
jgi:hypothetical protein